MLTDPQKRWLESLGTAVVEQQQKDVVDQRKQALIQKLAADRKQQAQMLGEGADLQVSKGDKSTLMDTLDADEHDQTKVFDLDEQRDGYALARPDGSIEQWDPETGKQEEFQKHLAAGRAISEMVRQMESELTDGFDDKGQPCKVPLFTPEEIAAEIYQPLMRQGLLAETNIPDKYSQTKKMLDSTFEAYAERLKKDKKGTAKRLFDENFGLGKSVLGFLATAPSVGIQGASIDKAISGGDQGSLVLKADPGDNIKSIREGMGLQADKDGKWADDLSKANSGMNVVGQGLTFVFDDAVEGGKDVAGALGSGDEEADEAAQRAVAAARMAPALLASVSMTLGKAMTGVGLGLAASASFGSLCGAKLLARQLKTAPFEEAQAVELSRLIANGLKTTLEKLDPATSGVSAELVTGAGRAYTSMAALPDRAKVVEAVAGLNADALQALYAAAAETALAAGLTPTVLKLFETQAAQDEAKIKASEIMTAEFEDDTVEGVEPEQQTQHRKAFPGHDADWVKDRSGKFICAICQANNTDDPEIFAGALERRIAQLDRDTALLKWAVTVVNLGIDTAANFIAPLAIAGCAVKMMKNIYEAGCRTRDTVVFARKREGMYVAASAYSAPVSNFVYNGGLQSAHYWANAAFECAKMIGAILQCAGPFTAPAGAILTATASGVQALEAVIYEAKKRYDLEAGWKTYKAALSRPENRKLGLIALKKNPTLAKYSVAWGALIEKDVLVVDFIGACGLTPETLKDPNAKLDKVVEYLEKRMPDDNVITGRTVEEMAGWAPSKVALTAASWIAVKHRGETKGGVEPVDLRALELLLQQLDSQWTGWLAKATVKPTATVTTAARDACAALLKQLHSELGRYRPRRTEEAGGGINTEMDNVKAEFVRLVEERQTLVAKWVPV